MTRRQTRIASRFARILPRLLLASLGALPACAAPAKALAQAPGREAPAAPPSRFVLDIPNTKMAFAVYVNGWLIDHNPGGKQGYFSSTRLGAALADGQNTVLLYVDNPDHVPPPADRCEVRIRSEAGEAYHYEWKPGDPKRPVPFQATGHFTAHLPHGPYTWQRASKVTLDAQTKDGLNAFIRRVYGALNTKNVAEATALFASQFKDNYLSRGLSAAEAEADTRAEMVKDFADPHARMDPIDFTHLKYSVPVGERVVQIRRADDGFVFRDAAPPHAGYDVLFCLVDGKWTMIGPSGQ